MNVGVQKRRCQDFEMAFNALGSETRGMSPIAACVLLAAAGDYIKEGQNGGGYVPLVAGVPSFAMGFDTKSVDIQSAYSKCRDFWKIDDNRFRAQITQVGVDYVNEHMSVLKRLLGE